MTPSGHARRDFIERWEHYYHGFSSNRSALFFLQTMALLAVFVVFQYITDRATTLYTQRYFEPILVLELLDRIGWPLVLASVLAGVALVRYGHLGVTWSTFTHGRLLRNVTVALTVLIAWPMVTIAYNHYFDQAYLIDRGLLALLALLVWWRPACLLLFLPQFYLLLGQLIEPTLGGTVLAHKLQVSHALGLVAAATLVHALTRQRSTAPLVLLLVCFVAAQYWIPAVAKLRIGWLGSDELHLMPLVAHPYGFLKSLSSEQIVHLAQRLAPLDWLMRIAVIAVEGGCLLMLWRRASARWLLAAAMLFHLGVFALGGLLFWTWMALDAAVLVLLFNRGRWPIVHARVGFALSLPLIVGAGYWAHPPPLGWYITPVSYVYHIDATLDDGTQVALAPEFFAPYEDVFATGNFAYTSESHGVLVSTHGVTRDREVVRGLRAATKPEDVFALEVGRSRYSEARKQRLFEFLTRFVGNLNRSGERLRWVQSLQPPLQNYALRAGARFAGDQPVRSLTITERTVFYDSKTLSTIREMEVARLPVAM